MMGLKEMVKEEKGFTLMELLIVALILAVLIGLALPRFTGAREKARGDEAVNNLRLIFTGERMYRLDVNSFTATLAHLYPLYIEDPNADPDRAFDYTIPAATATTFTAQAERRSGPYSTGTISIDEDGDITTGAPWPFTY